MPLEALIHAGFSVIEAPWRCTPSGYTRTSVTANAFSTRANMGASAPHGGVAGSTLSLV